MDMKQIPEDPRYSVTPNGDVYSGITNIKLKASFNSDGYRVVQLGYGKTRKIANLVADAFIPRPNFVSVFEVAHGDGSRDNDCVENLRWATRTENQRDRFTHGTHIAGHNARDAKLTNSEVKSIRESLTWARGEIQRLADKYGVSYQSMHSICHNKTYKAEYIK